MTAPGSDRAKPVFVTGGTGYIGRALTRVLIERGYDVYALVRRESEAKLPSQARRVLGDALNASTFAHLIPAGATLVHLVGTPHPSPTKAAEFDRVDLASIRASTDAARHARVSHLIYVSVAHPAPVMQAYIAVRVQGEALVSASGIPGTIFRPWYVLGPGHRWPVALLPFYAIFRWLPTTRASALRLGLVSHRAMVGALVRAIATPPREGIRIVEVPDIRRLSAEANARAGQVQ